MPTGRCFLPVELVQLSIDSTLPRPLWTTSLRAGTGHGWGVRSAKALEASRRCYRTSVYIHPVAEHSDERLAHYRRLRSLVDSLPLPRRDRALSQGTHDRPARAVPIASGDAGHVLRIVSGRKETEYVSKKELASWLLHWTFPPGERALKAEDLGVWMQAGREATWEDAKRVLGEADPEWETRTPSSVLAVLAVGRTADPVDAEDALRVLGRRAALDDDPQEVASCLMGMARVALDAEKYAVLADVVDYACRYSRLLAGQAVMRQQRGEEVTSAPNRLPFFSSWLGTSSPTRAGNSPSTASRAAAEEDSELADSPNSEATAQGLEPVITPVELVPILAVMDALVYTPVALDRTISHQLQLLLSSLAALCRPPSSPMTPDTAIGSAYSTSEADEDPSLAQLRWTLPRLGILDRNRLLRASLATLRVSARNFVKLALAEMIAGYERPLTGTLQMAMKVFSRPGYMIGYSKVAARLAEIRGPLEVRDPEKEGQESPMDLITIDRHLRDVRDNDDLDLEAKTDVAIELLMPRIRLLYDFDPSSDDPAQLSVLTLQALNTARMHESAVLLWERWTAAGRALPTAALNAVLNALVGAGTPGKLVPLFEKHAVPRSSDAPATSSLRHDYEPQVMDPTQPSSTENPTTQALPKLGRTAADATTLYLYMRALEASHDYTAVWTLYTSLWSIWHVAPDEKHLALLMKSARKLTVWAVPNLSGPVLGRPRSRPTPWGRLAVEGETREQDEGRWDGKLACERAIEVFWATLYDHRPNVASDVHASIGRLAHANRWLNRWKGRSVPSAPSPRTSTLVGSEHMAIAPVLNYGDDRSHAPSGSLTPHAILPTPKAFKEFIELLGMVGLGHEIPVALAWMKALQIESPPPGLLEAAYLWFTHSAPRKSELSALNDFVADWIGSDRIPTDEAMAIVVSRRAHAHRFGSILRKGLDAEDELA